MLTGELRGQIDGIWNDFWSGGLANPLQVIASMPTWCALSRFCATLSRGAPPRLVPHSATKRI